MEKTIEIQLKELREQIAVEIESGCTLGCDGTISTCFHCENSASVARGKI